MVVVGLMKDAHQARGLVRALDDAGFSGEDIDMGGGLMSDLIARGVPEEDTPAYAEGVRRGGALVCVRTDDDGEAAEAAELMKEHGAIDLDACAAGWQAEGYALVFGDYPIAPGRIHRDPRNLYAGPERRVMDRAYAGVNRRAA